MRVTFLIRNIGGIGGAIKTTINTTESLVKLGHDVKIVSCIRAKKTPDFKIDPRVEVEYLWDCRAPEKGGERLSLLDALAKRRPSIMSKDNVTNMAESSKLLDKRVKRFLKNIDTDLLITTHTSLNVYAAKWAREDTVMVAQEHMYLDSYREPVQELIKSHYGRFDAVATITEADAEAYRQAMPEIADRVTCIPNSIPPNPGKPAELVEPVIMAAGRLTGMKGFDILIKAFAAIAQRHPEWKVRIYGRGRDRSKLDKLIGEHGMRGRIELMGAVAPLDAEWPKASIAVVPSRFEPFGLVIVEAMGAGVPVICSKVKHGPLELVEPGENGLLFKAKSVKELGKAMTRLIEDPALRHKLAAGGMSTAERFEPDRIAGLYTQLFDKVVPGVKDDAAEPADR